MFRVELFRLGGVPFIVEGDRRNKQQIIVDSKEMQFRAISYFEIFDFVNEFEISLKCLIIT